MTSEEPDMKVPIENQTEPCEH